MHGKRLALLFGLLSMLSLVYVLLVSAQDNLCTDGRLNCHQWQTGAVYCDASGVRVLYARSDSPRQGQIALSVSAGEINAQGIPSGAHLLLERTGDDYTLHRLTDGRLQFTAPGLEAGTLYEYRFPWPQCRESFVAPTTQQEVFVPTPIPTLTPQPTATPVIPITVTIDCPTPGQYTITIVSGYMNTQVDYNLTTDPTVTNLTGTLTGMGTSATQNYPGGGLYNVTGTYSVNGSADFPVNINGCQG